MYFEHFEDINDAISREKQVKNWKRQWKENLIYALNPDWQNVLSSDFEPDPNWTENVEKCIENDRKEREKKR